MGILPPVDCLVFQGKWLLGMWDFMIYKWGIFKYCLWYFFLSSSLSFLLLSFFFLFCYFPPHIPCFFLCPLPRAFFLILYFIFFNYFCLLFLTLFFCTYICQSFCSTLKGIVLVHYIFSSFVYFFLFLCFRYIILF